MEKRQWQMVAKKAKPFASCCFSWQNCCSICEWKITRINFSTLQHTLESVLFPCPGPKHSYGRVGSWKNPTKDSTTRTSGHKPQWVTANTGSPEPEEENVTDQQETPCNSLFPGASRSHTPLFITQWKSLHFTISACLVLQYKEWGKEPEKSKVLPYPIAAESKAPWKDNSSYESKRLRDSHSRKMLRFISL